MLSSSVNYVDTFSAGEGNGTPRIGVPRTARRGRRPRRPAQTYRRKHLIHRDAVPLFSLRLGHKTALKFPECYSLPFCRFATSRGRLQFCIVHFAFCIYIMCGAHYVLLFHSFQQLSTTGESLDLQGVFEVLRGKDFHC